MPLDLAVRIPYLIISLAAAAGFFIAFTVNRKKRESKPMVCPLNFSCDEVVKGEFSTFFGAPVEVLGMFYYAATALSYGAVALKLVIPSPFFIFILLAFATAAFLFSLYLTFIQAVFLKQWCSWCLMSASLSILIFIMAVAGTGRTLDALLAGQRALLNTVHLLGLTLGLGGATISDLLFVKFLKDNRISEDEADVLTTLRHFTWFGLALLVATGVGLYLAEPANALTTPLSLFELGVIVVVIVNGAFLNLFITPKLVDISFGKRHDHREGELRLLRRAAFAFGTIAILSWYTLFLIKTYPTLPLPFSALVILYGSLILLGFAGSQIAESLLAKRAQE